MARTQISEGQGKALVDSFVARGMTPNDVSWFTNRRDSIFHDMLILGRGKIHRRRPEEYALHQACGERYVGAHEAHLYFGTQLTQAGLADLKKHSCALLSQWETMSPERRGNILIAWMPPISLKEIYDMLPQGYFPDHTEWFRRLAHEGATYEKMNAGFRMFERSDTPVEDKDWPSLTECVYLNVALHLMESKHLYHEQILCIHGEIYHVLRSNKRRCTFRGWSGDPNDCLGFDITENYAFLEERKAATRFSCTRHFMTP